MMAERRSCLGIAEYTSSAIVVMRPSGLVTRTFAEPPSPWLAGIKSCQAARSTGGRMNASWPEVLMRSDSLLSFWLPRGCKNTRTGPGAEEPPATVLSCVCTSPDPDQRERASSYHTVVEGVPSGKRTSRTRQIRAVLSSEATHRSWVSNASNVTDVGPPPRAIGPTQRSTKRIGRRRRAMMNRGRSAAGGEAGRARRDLAQYRSSRRGHGLYMEPSRAPAGALLVL